MALDPERIARVVAGIPAGRWMSYGDVARACGGGDAHARTLNQQFIRHGIVGAHRVLMDDGAVGRTALRDRDAVRTRLEAEGIGFEGGRADPRARVRPSSGVA